jgi:hypothetical protein
VHRSRRAGDLNR